MASAALTRDGIGVGADKDGLNAFNIQVDEIGIWTQALSTTDITQLYNGGAGLQYPFTTFTPAYTTGFFKFFKK